MSDSKSSYGEPVEEHKDVDDVVGRAHEGLADAEAAGRDAVIDGPDAERAGDEPLVADGAADAHTAYAPHDTDAAAEPSVTPSEPISEPVVHAEPAYAEPTHAEPVATEHAYTEPAYAEPAYAEPAYAEPAYAEPAYAEPAYAEPAYAEPAAPAVVMAPQPIFVQAPEAPRPRGNRGAAGAIGLLAALCFGVLYLAAWLGFGAITGDVTVDNVGQTALAALSTWALWVPVVVFFLAFWLLGAIINRGRWGVWVITGLLVGIASYGGHILGQLFQVPFWMLTASEGAKFTEGQLLAPLAIAAFVFGRELTIWFGAWVAARGARVTELNVEAQREYERTLEAGPQLVRQ